MEKNKQPSINIFCPEIQKEIDILPQELIKKRKKIESLKKEIINIKEKLKIAENQLKKNNNELIKEEENLTKLLFKKHSLKLKQKKIINSINNEIFINIIQNLMRENKYYKEILLLYFNFKDEYKEELQFIIQNKESFIDLINNSYTYLELLYKENTSQFNSIRQKIINLINNNKDINDDKINQSFNYIIEFINNSFDIISFKIKLKQINDYIKKKSIKKNSIFLNKMILENSIQDKEQKLSNLEMYCKYANNIIEKNQNLKNNGNEKEIIRLLSNLKEHSLSYTNINKIKSQKKDNKKDIKYELKKSNDKEKEEEKKRGKEKIRHKKIIISKEKKVKDKKTYIRNEIKTLNSNKNKNQKLKELSYIEIFNNNQTNIIINTSLETKNNANISFNHKNKSIKNINNNHTINPKRPKYMNGNGQIFVEKTIEKQKVNRMLLQINNKRRVCLKYQSKKNSDIVNIYNNIIIKEYLKSRSYEISPNKSLIITDNIILKTEAGNNKITNMDAWNKRCLHNSFAKKKK